jgi:membrane protein implicated in regulation of membrane protease activity
MTGSVYFALLLVIILFVLGVLMSPLFIIPAVAVLLFLLFSGPLLAMIRTSGTRRSTGTPTTSEASYEPVGDPDQRRAV